MWGTRWNAEHWYDRIRFIPTHVGNSRRGKIGPREIPVHPHACGELMCPFNYRAIAVGSSPRMWGTPTLHWNLTDRSAVHPHACGELNTMQLDCIHATVHPHACGELYTEEDILAVSVGSSPRMWGTHGVNPKRWLLMSVHPHACGELSVFFRWFNPYPGSSPRMWGTQ